MKILPLAILVLCVNLIFAQESTKNEVVNKKGVPILPKQGDIGIGISAQPFLEYFGNIFSSDYSPTPVFSSSNPGSIALKYNKSDDAAYRFGIMIGITGTTDKEGNPVNSDEYDKYKQSALTIGLSAGIEKYKSFKRLRGHYGADISISKNAYNGLRYQSFNDYVNGKYSFVDAENLNNNFEEKGGNTYTIGAQGIIGVEYFIAPKLSLSGEIGVVLYGSSTTDRKFVPEDGDEVVFNPGGYAYGITTNTSSLIALIFYF